MKYPIAERFKAPQGEGVHAGVPMAFIRTVGCSVGQKVCTACDTEFDKTYPALGGGMYTEGELVDWVLQHVPGDGPYRHACITGGEPFDRDLRPLIFACMANGIMCHVETSGTKLPPWLRADPHHSVGSHMIAHDLEGGRVGWYETPLWITVSPKPGWKDEMVTLADELKVILGGLGDGPGWPTLTQAVQWSQDATLRRRAVYVQQRNQREDIDHAALQAALAIVHAHPTLRLSVQMHKFLRTR